MASIGWLVASHQVAAEMGFCCGELPTTRSGATGTGPVDAVYKAIDQIMGVSVILETYSMNSVNGGIEALASTRVVINPTVNGPNDSSVVDAQTSQLRDKRNLVVWGVTLTSVRRRHVLTLRLNKLLTLQMRRMTHESEIKDPTGINGAVPVEVGAPSVVVALIDGTKQIFTNVLS
jgi:2-isopropylmalate synthase